MFVVDIPMILVWQFVGKNLSSQMSLENKPFEIKMHVSLVHMSDLMLL